MSSVFKGCDKWEDGRREEEKKGGRRKGGVRRKGERQAHVGIDRRQGFWRSGAEDYSEAGPYLLDDVPDRAGIVEDLDDGREPNDGRKNAAGKKGAIKRQGNHVRSVADSGQCEITDLKAKIPAAGRLISSEAKMNCAPSCP